MNLLAVITGNDSVQALIGSLFSNYTNIYFPLRGKHTVDTFNIYKCIYTKLYFIHFYFYFYFTEFYLEKIALISD